MTFMYIYIQTSSVKLGFTVVSLCSLIDIVGKINEWEDIIAHGTACIMLQLLLVFLDKSPKRQTDQ